MSRTFVVPDLHGRRDLLVAGLSEIERRANGGRVVFLGDYVDRGPESRGVLERLMRGPGQPGWAWTCLKGNHEDMLLQVVASPGLMDWWIGNGGDATLASYRDTATRPLAFPLPSAHLDWLAGLPEVHADQHRVYVHAGLDESFPLDRQPSETLLWKRYGQAEVEGYRGKHIVHGHTPIEAGPLMLAGRTDLDTLAWYTGRLVIGDFDDEFPGGPRELIEVIGAPA